MKTARKLLLLNYSMDETSSFFAHSVSVANGFAAKFDCVTVITLGEYNCQVAPNVGVIPLRLESEGKFKKLLVLVGAFLNYAIKNRRFILFAHMAELPFVVVAPFVRLMGNSANLWYAHASKPKYWTFILFFASRIFTSTRGSIPKVNTRKIVYVGQGIDTKLFPFAAHEQRANLFLIAGRVDPSKRVNEMIRYFLNWRSEGLISRDAQLTIVGSATPHNSKYEFQLRKAFDAYAKLGIVKFVGPVRHSALKHIFAEHDIMLHAFQGSLDKILLESTMCGLPVVTVNTAFLGEFDSWSRSRRLDKEEIGDFLLSEICIIESLSKPEFLRRLRERRKISLERHSLDHWIKRILDIMLK